MKRSGSRPGGAVPRAAASSAVRIPTTSMAPAMTRAADAEPAVEVDAAGGDQPRLRDQQQQPAGEQHAVQVDERGERPQPARGRGQDRPQVVGLGEADQHGREQRERVAAEEPPLGGGRGTGGGGGPADRCAIARSLLSPAERTTPPNGKRLSARRSPIMGDVRVLSREPNAREERCPPVRAPIGGSIYSSRSASSHPAPFRALLSLSLLLASPLALRAADDAPISTDRPDQTDSTDTAPERAFQLETGWQRTSDTEAEARWRATRRSARCCATGSRSASSSGWAGSVRSRRARAAALAAPACRRRRRFAGRQVAPARPRGRDPRSRSRRAPRCRWGTATSRRAAPIRRCCCSSSTSCPTA